MFGVQWMDVIERSPIDHNPEPSELFTLHRLRWLYSIFFYFYPRERMSVTIQHKMKTLKCWEEGS
jgi:hypothetical protein